VSVCACACTRACARVCACAPAWQLFLWLGVVAAFYVANFTRFQPKEVENVKLLYYSLCVASPFVASVIVSLYTGSSLFGGSGAAAAAAPTKAGQHAKGAAASQPGSVVAIVLVVLLTTSGLLSVLRETQSSVKMYTKEDFAVRGAARLLECCITASVTCRPLHAIVVLQVAKWLIENTRTETVVLAADEHVSPAFDLAGRTALVGHVGQLLSRGAHPNRSQCCHACCVPVCLCVDGLRDQGLDYHHRHNDRIHVLHNFQRVGETESRDKLYAWGVKIVVHRDESPEPRKINETFLNDHVKRAFQAKNLHVYRVKHQGDAY
jgi:hypothetical protein